MQLAIHNQLPPFTVYSETGDLVNERPLQFDLLSGACEVRDGLLTDPELRVLVLASLGFTMQNIANATYRSLGTIKGSAKIINTKLDVAGQGMYRAVDAAFDQDVLRVIRPIAPDNFAVDEHVLQLMAQAPSNPIITPELRDARHYIAQATGITHHTTMLVAAHMAGRLPLV